MKRAGESALVAVSADPVGRADLEIKLAQTREREAEDMAARGDGDRAVAALDSRYQLLRAASRDLLATSAHTTRWTSARTRCHSGAIGCPEDPPPKSCRPPAWPSAVATISWKALPSTGKR